MVLSVQWVHCGHKSMKREALGRPASSVYLGLQEKCSCTMMAWNCPGFVFLECDVKVLCDGHDLQEDRLSRCIKLAQKPNTYWQKLADCGTIRNENHKRPTWRRMHPVLCWSFFQLMCQIQGVEHCYVWYGGRKPQSSVLHGWSETNRLQALEGAWRRLAISDLRHYHCHCQHVTYYYACPLPTCMRQF